MKKLFFYISAIILTGIINPSFAQEKETPPAGGKAKDFKLSEKKTVSYANGLKSTTVHYGELPKATITLIVKTGNAHENNNEIWLADLTGRLLREGTATMNAAALSKKAAMMGGSLNVSVGLAQTVISGTVLSEYAPDFIKLISSLVTEPAFPSTELERLKGDLKRRLITQKNVPQTQASEQ